jgi:hypothetical protein
VGYDFPWKRRLGRMRMTLDGRQTEIHLNGLPNHPEVPGFARIALNSHEIGHYAHGFGSPSHRACGCARHDLIARDLAQYDSLRSAVAQAAWPDFAARLGAGVYVG